MKILVTGSNGFVGKNLCYQLKYLGYEVFGYDLGSTDEELKEYVKAAEFIVHLAGINRPLDPKEFMDGNVNFTKKLLDNVKTYNSKAPIFMSSSTQAAKDNPYGVSKKMAEDELFAFSKENGHPVYVYRFHNVFGKWCKPNYNSVIATWCYNVSHDLPIEVNESNPAIDFVYIDDIVKEIVRCIKGEKKPSNEILYVEPIYNVHLFDVRDTLYSFRDSRKTLDLPLLKPGFFKDLYSTYLSYIEPENYVYDLNMHCDNRGSFTEMLHMDGYGQVSVNIAHPGIVKGNHYHNNKNEKYIVVTGSADIKLRKLGSDEVITFHCDGSHLQVVDIPPGYTHSIMATGDQDAVTVMWANEPFDPQNPDTIMEMVER